MIIQRFFLTFTVLQLKIPAIDGVCQGLVGTRSPAVQHPDLGPGLEHGGLSPTSAALCQELGLPGQVLGRPLGLRLCPTTPQRALNPPGALMVVIAFVLN